MEKSQEEICFSSCSDCPEKKESPRKGGYFLNSFSIWVCCFFFFFPILFRSLFIYTPTFSGNSFREVCGNIWDTTRSPESNVEAKGEREQQWEVQESEIELKNDRTFVLSSSYTFAEFSVRKINANQLFLVLCSWDYDRQE